VKTMCRPCHNSAHSGHASLGRLIASTLLDEALTPVDRDVFRREVTYYGAIKGGADAAVPQAPSTEK